MNIKYLASAGLAIVLAAVAVAIFADRWRKRSCQPIPSRWRICHQHPQHFAGQDARRRERPHAIPVRGRPRRRQYALRCRCRGLAALCLQPAP